MVRAESADRYPSDRRRRPRRHPPHRLHLLLYGPPPSPHTPTLTNISSFLLVHIGIKRRAITKRIARAPLTPGLANQSGRRLPSIDGIVNVAGAGGVAAVSRTGSGSSRSRPGQQINRSDSGASSYSQNSMRSGPVGPRVIAVGGPESASLSALPQMRTQGGPGLGPQAQAARGLG